MNSFFDKLNLRPQERRLVVVVGIVLFVVLNIWFVWPYFDDWKQARRLTSGAEATLKRYQDEIGRVGAHEERLKQLESEGSSVVSGSQQLDLTRTVLNQSRASKVNVTRYDPTPKINSGETNQFFEEQSLTISVTTGNEELVNFLVSLASTNSLIRVRDMRLGPDGSGTRLSGDLTLIASYQRDAPISRASPPAGGKEGPARGGQSTNSQAAPAAQARVASARLPK